jgi:hypothetical protein
MYCNVPIMVLERMTCSEVSKLVAELMEEADALAVWNNQRPEPQPSPPAWQVTPPPKSLDDYGRPRR